MASLHPRLFELHAVRFLRRESERAGRRLTIGAIPDEFWKSLSAQGFDFAWLMGVWARSPIARAKALQEPALRAAYDFLLPGWTEDDVAGSPYAIHGYRLEERLGAAHELGACRKAMHRRGIGLIVDFVPNHLAMDHPWTLDHPDRFIRLSPEQRQEHPRWAFRTARDQWLAHGRDPHFEPWNDTVQIDLFSPEMRKALIGELTTIASQADGVRCDMAMLAVNAVFARTWDGCAKDAPAKEFWAEVIGAVKRRHPGFLFIAEAYWGMEWELQQLGFDYTYDKVLYDRLLHDSPERVREHLWADAGFQNRMVRFIENHDEPRAVTAFGRERSLAAAVIGATLPGMRLVHEGQADGWRHHIPVQLGRNRDEDTDAEVRTFYDRLLKAAADPVIGNGEWTLLAVNPAWEGHGEYTALLAWMWRRGGSVRVVVVNYSPRQAQGRVPLPPVAQSRGSVAIEDRLQGDRFTRDPAELRSPGLYVSLAAWASHLLAFEV